MRKLESWRPSYLRPWRPLALRPRLTASLPFSTLLVPVSTSPGRTTHRLDTRMRSGPLEPPPCGRRDSNPHALRHRLLRPACLPIPPRPQGLSIVTSRLRPDVLVQQRDAVPVGDGDVAVVGLHPAHPDAHACRAEQRP